jgi:hypothetical protein
MQVVFLLIIPFLLIISHLGGDRCLFQTLPSDKGFRKLEELVTKLR